MRSYQIFLKISFIVGAKKVEYLWNTDAFCRNVITETAQDGADFYANFEKSFKGKSIADIV